MKKTQLDDKIILYKENEIFDFFDILKKIEDQESTENVWQLSSPNNINNTDLTNKSEILVLEDTRIFLNSQKITKYPAPHFGLVNRQSEFNIKKLKLKNCLISFSLPFILEYLEETEQTIQNIKPWVICKNIKSENFISNEARNEISHKNTIIICLSKEHSGGGVQFRDRVGNETTPLNEGDVLIYPSGTDYSHKIYPAVTGDQYLAVTYF